MAKNQQNILDAGFHNVADVIKKLAIGKTTFLRWEKEGKVPPAHRDQRGWRYYTDAEYTQVLKVVADSEYFRKPLSPESTISLPTPATLVQPMSLDKLPYLPDSELPSWNERFEPTLAKVQLGDAPTAEILPNNEPILVGEPRWVELHHLPKEPERPQKFAFLPILIPSRLSRSLLVPTLLSLFILSAPAIRNPILSAINRIANSTFALLDSGRFYDSQEVLFGLLPSAEPPPPPPQEAPLKPTLSSEAELLWREISTLRAELNDARLKGFRIEGEKIVERTIEKVISGLSSEEIEQRLSALRRSLDEKTQANFNAIALTQRINTLGSSSGPSVTIASPTITGTLGSLTVEELTVKKSCTGCGGGGGSAAAGWTDDGTIVRLTDAGDLVGIGTSSPNQAFSVQGNALFSGNVSLANLTATDTTRFNGITYTWPSSLVDGNFLQTDASGNLIWAAAGGGGGADGNWTFVTTSGGFVRLATTSNRVGIGTTTPYAKLSVESGAIGTTTLALVPFASQSANILDIYSTSGSLFSVITSAGRLGLGTTSPAQLLSIQGNALISGTTTIQGLIATSTIIVQGNATSTFTGGLSVGGGGLASSQGLTITGGSILASSIPLTAGAGSFTSLTNAGTLSNTGLSTLAGFISTASSTISSGGLVVSGSPLQASSTVILVGGTGTSTFAGGVSVASIGGLSSGAGLTISGGNISQSNTATNTLRGISIPQGGLTVGTLVSCNTIDTDASGNFACGTDAGITSLNGLTGTTQTFSAVNTSNDWNVLSISSSGSTHTFTTSASTSPAFGFITATSTTRASEFLGLVKLQSLNASSTATSTFTGGISVASTGGLTSGSGLTITGGNILQTNTATNTLRGLDVAAGGLRISTILNCNGASTLDTDASGNIICGADADTGNISGWTDDGTLVRLTTQTDNVAVGTTSADVRSVLTIGATSTTANLLTLRTLSGQTGDALIVQNIASSTIFRLNTSGGFIGTASSTVNASFTVSGNLAASSTLQATGATRLFNTLTVDGVSTLSGLTTLGSGFVSQASSTAVSTLSVGGNLSASSTLQVTGLTTLFGNLNASSTATSTFAGGISSGLSVGGLASANGLVLTGGQIISQGTGTSTFSGGIDVNAGGIQLSTVLNCNGTLVLETDASGNIQCGADGGGAANVGWTDDGTLVRLETQTDNVAIGTTSADVRSVLTVGATTTPSNILTLRTLTGQTGDALVVQDIASSTIFRLNTSGGFIATASSTLTNGLIVTGSPIQASSTVILVGGTGTSTFAGGISSTGGGGLASQNGLTVLGGSIQAAGIPLAAGATTLNGLATLGSGFLSQASSTAVSSLNVGGNLAASSTLQVTGLTTLFGNLNASSTATSTFAGGISSGLSAGGLASANGLVLTGGHIISQGTGTSTFSGGIDVNAGGIQLSTVLNCNGTLVLETDASGNIQCGADGGGAANVGWTDDGTLVRLETQTDNVAIGTTSADVRSVLTVGATSTTANLLTLRMTGGQSGNPLVVQNISSTTVFTLDPNGGFIATASSTISSGGLVVSGSPIQASSTVILVGGTGTSTFAGGISSTGGGGLSSANGLTVTGGSILASGIPLTAGAGSFTSLTNSGTLSNTGLATLSGGFVSQASSTAVSTLSVGGALSASSTLQVTGAARFFSTLQADGLSTLNGFISQASSTVANTLNVRDLFQASSTILVGGTGTSTFAGGISVASIGGLTSGSGLTITGGNILQTNTAATNTLASGLIVSGGGIRISTITNCTGASTLDTDSSGNIFCGTDADTGNISGWTDDGTLVRLTTQTDNVAIGTTSADVRSVLTVGATTTPSNILTLRMTGGQTGNPLVVQNISSTTVFTLDPNGGFIATASSTISSGGLVVSGSPIQASSTVILVGGSATSTFAGGISSTGGGGLSSANGLTVTGGSILASGIPITAGSGSFTSLTNSGTLSNTGLATLAGGFVSQASSTAVSTLSVGGALAASSTLQVTGASRLFSTLQADGATTLGSTLSVSGLSTLAGFISTASSTISSGGLLISGSPLQASSTVILVGGSATSTFAGGISVASIGGLTSGSGLTITGGNILQTNNATNTFGGGLVVSAGGLRVSTLNCTVNANGGALTTDSSGNVICSDDDAGAGASGWTDDGTLVRLTTQTDNVAIGTTSADVRSVLTVGATTTPSNILTLRTLTGQTGDALIVQNIASSTIFRLNSSGGFIATASSTVDSSLTVSGNLAASSTLQATGAGRFYSTLRADGLSTLAGFISTASSTVNGALTATGNIAASSTLQVTGASRFEAQARFEVAPRLVGFNCSGTQVLETDSTGVIQCGTDDTGGGGGGSGNWTYDNAGTGGLIRLATTSNRVGIGTTSPYAKLSIDSGAAATTTFALVPFSGQTANIIDIYNTSGALTSVYTSSDRLGIGTTSPAEQLGVANRIYVGGTGTSTFTGGITALSLNSSQGLTLTGGNILNTSSATSTFTASGLSVAGGGLASSQGLTLTGGKILSTSAATSSLAGGVIVSAGGIQIGTILNCNGASTLDTDASGNIVCGADADTGNISGWSDDGTLVRLTTNTDNVSIGTTSADVRSVLTVGATSTTANLLTLRTLTGQTGDALIVQDIASSTVFRLNPSGGFIATASSTVNAPFTVSGNLAASSTLQATGATRLFNTLTVDGASTLSGLTTLGSGFLSQASSTAVSTLNVGGNLAASSTLQVSGLTTLFGNLNASSTATSTFAGGISSGLLAGGLASANGLVLTGGQIISQGTGTSTFAGGIDVNAGGVQLSTVLSCNNTLALATDASGNIICDTDDSGGGASGWTDDGTLVRLTTQTDNVAIGTTSADVRSVLTVGATTTPSNILTLRTLTGQTGDALIVQNIASSTLFRLNTSGGFIGTASSTVNAPFTVSGNLAASSTLQATGATRLFNTLTVDGASTLSGLATLGSGFVSQASSTAVLTLSVGGALAASSTLQATGATRLFNTLTVDNTSTFSGLATLSAAFLSQASSTVVGGLTVSGAPLQASSTVLLVGGTGTSTFSGGVSVGGGGLFSSNGLSITGGSISNTSSASSTWTGGLSVGGGGLASSQGLTLTGGRIVHTGLGTSTFASGLDISAGCFAINGTCVGGGAGGAPTGATYVTLTNDATLTAERTLAGTLNQINITDGGANNNVTLSLNGFTTLGTFNATNTASTASSTILHLLGVGTTTPSTNFIFTAHGNSLLAGTTTVNGLIATSSLIVQGTATSTFTNSGISVAGGGLASSQGLTITGGSIRNLSTATSTFDGGISATHLAASNGLTVSGGNITTVGNAVISHQTFATTTVSDTTINIWSMATSTSVGSPFLSVSTFLGTGVASNTPPGRLGLGTTTPESRLSIDSTTACNFCPGGIDEQIRFNQRSGAVSFGNRLVVTDNSVTTPHTGIGQFIRIIDDSGLANTIRGMEIQAHSGTTTLGVNTGLIAFGKTFGVQGISKATAAGSLVPAGIYAENQGTSTGQALRIYTSTSTTADLALFYQEGTQTFSGTGLKMNFGKGAGPFTGNFIDFQVNDVSRLVASSSGTIGIGTSTPLKGVVDTHRGLVIESGAMTAGTGTPLFLLSTSDASNKDKIFITAVSSITGTPDYEFRIDTQGSVSADQNFTGGGADVAEWFPAKEARPGLEPGDLVSIDGSSSLDLVKKSEGVAYDSKVVGIVSTKPGLVSGGGSVEDSHSNDVLVALVGRVPVKVSNEGGQIRPGDRITSSSIPGVAMKATTSGITIGMALEAFDDTNYLSDGVVGVETNEITEESIYKRLVRVFKDNTNYGGEVDPTRLPGSEKEVEVEELVSSSTQKVIAPENSAAKDVSLPSGQNVKVGKILVFVNLSWVKVDSDIFNSGELWYVDQATGRVKAKFTGGIDLAGNNIENVGRILSQSGTWSIDETGKLIVQEIETQELKVGSPTNPSGVTLYDTASGEPYCLRITNGAPVASQGECSPVSGNSQSPISNSQSSTNDSMTNDTEPPTITIQGNNPAVVEVKQSYADLGVIVTDNMDQNLGYKISVDGVEVREVQIDTSQAGEHSVVYSASDQAGNTASATRIVRVVEPNTAQTTTASSTEVSSL